MTDIHNTKKDENADILMKYNEIPTSEQLLLELTMPMGCNYYNLVKYAVCGEL